MPGVALPLAIFDFRRDQKSPLAALGSLGGVGSVLPGIVDAPGAVEAVAPGAGLGEDGL